MGTQDRHQEDGDSKVTDLTPSGRGSVSSTWKFPALVANSEVTWGSHPAPPVHPCAHPHLPGTSTRGPGGLCTTDQAQTDERSSDPPTHVNWAPTKCQRCARCGGQGQQSLSRPQAWPCRAYVLTIRPSCSVPRQPYRSCLGEIIPCPPAPSISGHHRSSAFPCPATHHPPPTPYPVPFLSSGCSCISCSKSNLPTRLPGLRQHLPPLLPHVPPPTPL